jgi:uncharacterized protein YjbI with pentapeptide repeats
MAQPIKIAPPQIVDEESYARLDQGAPAAGQAFSRVVIRHADWSGSRAADLRFEEAVWGVSALRQTVWHGVSFIDARLKGCDLSNADWQHAHLARVEIEACNLTGANFARMQVNHVRCESSKLLLAGFAGVKFTASAFHGCNLEQADFTGADLRGVVFADCNLRQARFFGATLTGADLRGSDLAGLGVTPHDLGGAIVEKCQLADLAPLLGVIVE